MPKEVSSGDSCNLTDEELAPILSDGFQALFGHPMTPRRCGNIWDADWPDYCPKCASYFWDRPPTKGRKGGRVSKISRANATPTSNIKQSSQRI